MTAAHRNSQVLTATKRIINESLFRRSTPPAIQDLMMRWGKRALGTRLILLACFPKSGSTFISRTMHELPGFTKLSAVPLHDRREQELERESIRSLIGLRKNAVYQHHVRHSLHLEHLIADYNIHVVVMVRDLRDVCQSVADHLNSEGPVWFSAFLDENILNGLNRHNRLPGFIVDLVIPWYVNFYAGWTAYDLSGGSVQWIHYEDMVGNELATISSILTGAGLEVSESEIQRALNQPRFTRVNVGKVGRGREFVREHPEVAETIERYLSYYPDVDFRPIYDPTR